MNRRRKSLLYRELFAKIARMHEEVAYRKHLNHYNEGGGSCKDYPNVSIGAELNGFTAVGHHHYYSRVQDFHKMIYRKLTLRLGDLNKFSRHYPLCKNKVGHCAENYAASGVLRQYDPRNSVHDGRILYRINFTKAIQPRTYKTIEMCANCHTMYG